MKLKTLAIALFVILAWGYICFGQNPCAGPWASVFRATNGVSSTLWTNTTGTNCFAWFTNTSNFTPAPTHQTASITRMSDGKQFCSTNLDWNSVSTTPGSIWRFVYQRNPVVTNGTWSFSLAWHD